MFARPHNTHPKTTILASPEYSTEHASIVIVAQKNSDLSRYQLFTNYYFNTLEENPSSNAAKILFPIAGGCNGECCVIKQKLIAEDLINRRFSDIDQDSIEIQIINLHCTKSELAEHLANEKNLVTFLREQILTQLKNHMHKNFIQSNYEQALIYSLLYKELCSPDDRIVDERSARNTYNIGSILLRLAQRHEVQGKDEYKATYKEAGFWLDRANIWFKDHLPANVEKTQGKLSLILMKVPELAEKLSSQEKNDDSKICKI